MPETANPTFSGPYDHEFDPPEMLNEDLLDSYAPLASPWTRLGAFIVNYLLFGLAMVPGIAILVVGEGARSDAIAAVGGLVLLASVVGFLLYQAVLLSREGQSLGKRLFELRIVDARDDSNPGFGRVIGSRFILMQALALIPFVGLIDALMIFTEEHKTLHDRLASTVVVTEKGLFADERSF